MERNAFDVRSAGMSYVVYHGTPIVIFSDEFIILSNKGWFTSSTKRRMNKASDENLLGFYVYQKNWTWYVTLPNGETIEFYDNMIIDRHIGNILEPKADERVDAHTIMVV